MRLVLDTIDDSSFEEDTAGRVTISRGFQVYEIPAKDRSDPFVLIRAAAAAGLPRWDSPHPYSAAYRVRRRTIRPMGPNCARGRLDYVRQDLSGTRRIDWVFEEETGSYGEQTQNDVNGNPIQAVYRPGGNAKTVSKTVTMPVSLPLRVIVANALVNEWPGDPWFDAQGTVNLKPWMGKPTAFWKCDSVRAAAQSDDSGNYALSGRWSTKIHWDWSNYGWYVAQATGQIPQSVVDDKAARQAVLRAPYSNTQDQTANGFVKVGLYLLTDFQRIFGLSDKDRRLGPRKATVNL